MCLIAFAWNHHPRWPLVLCANRDEFHNRPTAALGRWDDASDIVGGRDLQAGGSWLALAAGGKLAAVTNVREPGLKAGLKSRGELVRGYLQSDLCAVAYAEQARIEGADYGPYNLLLWDGLELVHVSNRPVPAWAAVSRGVHAVSNGRFDEPWPKTLQLNLALDAWLKAAPAHGEPDVSPLLRALADRHIAADALLPDTGIGLEHERLLSPAFIELPGYGTRASTVVLIAPDGIARLVERRFGPNGTPLGERELRADLRSHPLQLSE